MTLSIVARDALSGELGAATATAGPAVGALVIHGQSGVGGIARTVERRVGKECRFRWSADH